LQKLPLKKVKEILEFAEELGIDNVVVTGGEPFLYGRELTEVLKTCRRLGFNTRINSNGSIVDEEIFSAMEKYNVGIRVSLYGASEESYEKVTGVRAFKKVTNFLSKISKRNILLSIGVVLLKGLNEHEAHKMVELAHKFTKYIDIYDVFFDSLDGRPTKEYMLPSKPNIEEEAWQHPASTIKREILHPLAPCPLGAPFISSRGDVRPCLFVGFSYGNVFKDDFEKIKRRMQRYNLRKVLSPSLPGAGGLCNYFPARVFD